MYDLVSRKNKDDQLHIRMKPDVKADLQILADSRGLTMSSYVHSLIVKEIRAEKIAEPSLFVRSELIMNETPSPITHTNIEETPNHRVIYTKPLEMTDEREWEAKQQQPKKKRGK